MCLIPVRCRVRLHSLLPTDESHKEVFVTSDCNGDVHWAERLNGLSTEWKAHPEDKYVTSKWYILTPECH